VASRRQAPIIGITCDVHRKKLDYSDYELVCDHRYAEAVKGAGGHPVLIPIARRNWVLRQALEGIDGLLIVGGDDVDPRLYGERPLKGTKLVFPARTAFERWLYEQGRRRNLPVLGICYGMQLINVLEGGTLYQDIRRDFGSPMDHRGRRDSTHTVSIRGGSRLARILGVSQVSVPTQHHQAVRRLAPGFKAVAYARDGIIEAIESRDDGVMAVQWHPERAIESVVSKRLFHAFVTVCKARKPGVR
jgi:gamma-glutamyl-gamma-aminobutyrate hydrolase PuuD